MRKNILFLIISFIVLISCAARAPKENLQKVLPDLRHKKIAIYSCDFIEIKKYYSRGRESFPPERAYFTYNSELTDFFVNQLKLKKYRLVQHSPILSELKHYELPVNNIKESDYNYLNKRDYEYTDTLIAPFIEKIIEYGKMSSADVILFFNNQPGLHELEIKVVAYDTLKNKELGWMRSRAGGWFHFKWGSRFNHASEEQKREVKYKILTNF